MSGPDVAAVMARVDRSGRPLDQWNAAATWALARELGLTLTPTRDGRLHVAGDPRARAALLPALQRHKRALLNGRCSFGSCHNLAACPGGRCPACASIGPRTYRYRPGSIAERAYLAAVQASRAEGRPDREAA